MHKNHAQHEAVRALGVTVIVGQQLGRYVIGKWKVIDQHGKPITSLLNTDPLGTPLEMRNGTGGKGSEATVIYLQPNHDVELFCGDTAEEVVEKLANETPDWYKPIGKPLTKTIADIEITGELSF